MLPLNKRVLQSKIAYPKLDRQEVELNLHFSDSRGHAGLCLWVDVQLMGVLALTAA